jgi:hypothetical protein
LGGPQFELCVSGCAELHEKFLTAIVQLDTADDLRVAPIECFDEAQDRPQCADRLPPFRTQRAVIHVPFSGRRFAVIAGDQRDDLGFLRLEAAQVSILDQVIGMFVVPGIADMTADVVKQCGELEPFPLAIGEPMYAARLVES